MPLVKNPDPFKHYEGFSFDELPEYPGVVWSVGKTPEDAIRALCEARFGFFKEGSMVELEGDEKIWHWGYSFVADGTGMKAAGQLVPGGAVLTWWK